MVTKAVPDVKSGKQVAKAHWQCMACGSDFWGARKNPKCPKCSAEGFDLKELNAEGIPVQDVRRAVTGGLDVSYEGGNTIISGRKPDINLDYSRAVIGRADDAAAEMFERDMTATIQEDVISKVKAKAAESKAALLEQEKRLRELERTSDPDNEPTNPLSLNSISASTLIQSISGLPEEEREWWLSQIKDPQTVYGLATLLNPPKQTMQGSMPFPQQANPLMNLMGMRQQMEQQQPQFQQHQSSGDSESNSMLDMAEALKIMFDMARSAMPPPTDNTEANRAIVDAIKELRESQEKLNDRYYALRVEQLEGHGGGVTKEDIDAIVSARLAASNRSPLQSLRELKETLKEIDDLKGIVQPQTDIVHGEPIDEWVKKHTLEREMQEEKLRHEERIAAQNAKAAKWAVAKHLLSDGIKANIAARSRKADEAEEDEVDNSAAESLKRKKVTLVK